MPAALAADGVDYADFRRGLRDEITLEQLRRIMVTQNIMRLAAIKISHSAIRG